MNPLSHIYRGGAAETDTCVICQKPLTDDIHVTPQEQIAEQAKLPVVLPKPTSHGSINECVVCQKPLGQDTKDMGYVVCHEHRLCITCNLPLRPTEVRQCILHADETENDIVIQHPRCGAILKPTAAQDPTITIRQSEFDRLNLLRLMVWPDPNLSQLTNENNAMIQSEKLCNLFVHTMTFDQVYAHQKMLEACMAQVSIFIGQSRSELKKRASEKEEKDRKRVEKEAQTSSRPPGKDPEDNKEVALAEFMKNFSIKSRKVAIKLQRDRDKAVEAMARLMPGMSTADLKKSADDALFANIASGKVKVTEDA